jgi:sulfopyruvate decarboxylase TPP-binding subunit
MRATDDDTIIKALKAVTKGLKAEGVTRKLYPALDRDNEIHTIRVRNEDEGAAISGGVWLSGKHERAQAAGAAAAVLPRPARQSASVAAALRLRWARSPAAGRP